MCAWDDTKITTDTLTASEWNAHVTDQKSRPDISSGSGTPGTTPGKRGDIYVDYTGIRFFIAGGTSSSSDWHELMSS